MAWVILGFLVAALCVVVVLMLNAKKKPEHLREGAAMPDLAELGPMDARRGDTVSIMGRGHEFSDLDFTVDRINEYRQGADRWQELSGMYRGTRVFLEVWQDDGVFACLTGPDGEVGWSDVGLSEQDLVRLDESNDPGSAVSALGASWAFEDSGEVLFFEDGRGSGEGCYTWEFAEQDGPRVLTIEKWEGEPFEAIVSEMVAAGDVRVFRS